MPVMRCGRGDVARQWTESTPDCLRVSVRFRNSQSEPGIEFSLADLVTISSSSHRGHQFVILRVPYTPILSLRVPAFPTTKLRLAPA